MPIPACHPIRLSFVAALAFLSPAGAAIAQDADGDGVLDAVDNCIARTNPAQTNSDFDRFGNACDGDVNQDGLTDATDRNLIDGEIGDTNPRPIADLTGDGSVDQADLDWFDQQLVGNPPGPAGAFAHDADGDGLLDFCSDSPYHACMAQCALDFDTCYASCSAGGLPFPHRRDPALQPDLLTNGALTGDPPAGWSSLNPTYLDFTAEVKRTGDGAFQWLTWGGAGHGGGDLCGSSCVQPDAISVTPGRTYAYSFYLCMTEFPPTTLTMNFGEYDSGGGFLGNVGPLNNSKVHNAKAGEWEEVIYFYEPSSPAVASVRPRVFRKVGPGGSRLNAWADDFAFWELAEEGERTYRSPPARKNAFEGARTRVDELGNVRIRENGQWIDWLPFGVYVHHAQNFQVYSGAGFNVVMNERGFGVEAQPGIDAISPFNPEGMYFMFISHTWNDPTGLQLDQALVNLTTKTSPVRGIRLWDRLFAFNYDNEIFSKCGLDDDVTGECLQRMWEAQTAPLAEIFQEDRDQNGGVRGVPSYFLNGNPSAARAYDKPESAVNVQGDVRMNATGSYGAANIGHLERHENQTAPTLAVQIQTSTGDRYRSIAYGGVALGAKMIGTWRDWLPTAGSHGDVYKAPTLKLCGATDFGLNARNNFYDPPGDVVEGLTSGARAEILDDPAAYSSCTGDGASYRIHMVQGDFVTGEGLKDVATGQPVAGAVVDDVVGPFLVDYQITIDQRGWYAEVPKLRNEFEALAPILRQSHWTGWSAGCRALAPDQSVVPFGGDGVICATRTWLGKAYLFVSNTSYEIDPYAPWDQQIVGESLDVTVTLAGLPYVPVKAQPFDPAALEFTDTGHVPVAGGQFTVTVPPLGTAVYRLEAAPQPAPSRASDVAGGMTPMLVTGYDAEFTAVSLTYDPACNAVDHALLVGPLDQAGSYGYDRIACGLGTSGTGTAEIGPGDRFWLIVGRSLDSEGSAGTDSSGATERPAASSALDCWFPRQSGAACP